MKLKTLTLAAGMASILAGTLPTAAMAHYTGKPHNAGPRHRAAGDYHTNRDWRGYRDDRRHYDRERYSRRDCKSSGDRALDAANDYTAQLYPRWCARRQPLAYPRYGRPWRRSTKGKRSHEHR